MLAVFRDTRAMVMRDDGTVAYLTFAREKTPAPLTFIEAVGTPETDFFGLNLSRAIWRPLAGTGRIPDSPIDITAANILFDDKGRVRINHELRGRAVRLQGLLTHRSADDAKGIRLTIADHGTEIAVELGKGVTAPNELMPGCEISASGVCYLETDNWRPQQPFPRIQSVSVIIRNADDIHILRNRPWWTPARLLAVIAVLVVLLAGVFCWNRSLKRLSERRGKALAESDIARAESEMRMFERTRLAVDLHDSVAQTLNSVAMELEAAKLFTEGAPPNLALHLTRAGKTLQSCRDELRNCLWDLRSQVLEEPTLDGAIRKAVLPRIKGVEPRVRFNVPRKALTDETAHAILQIIRELATNGIKHGGARRIWIAGACEDGRLSFSVRDDGCGFEPDRAPGVPQGHFGLQGIRERVNRLNGRFAITTAPGKGTKATVSLPIDAKAKSESPQKGS